MTNALVVSRILPASPELAFRAWSNPEYVKGWFGPAQCSVPVIQIDFRVGGTFDLCMQSLKGQRIWTRGQFINIVANSRLAIDMQVFAHDERLLLRAHTIVGFAEQPDGATLVEIRQSDMIFDPANALMIENASEGWRQALRRLEREVVRIKTLSPPARSTVHRRFCIERTWSATRAQVFHALTDPRAKARWFNGDSGVMVIAREMDVRPGGRELLRARWRSGMVSTFDALYHDVVRDERLIYSYEMHLDQRKIAAALVTFELKSAASGTRLVMSEQYILFDGYDDHGAHEHAAGILLDALGKSLPHELEQRR